MRLLLKGAFEGAENTEIGRPGIKECRALEPGRASHYSPWAVPSLPPGPLVHPLPEPAVAPHRCCRVVARETAARSPRYVPSGSLHSVASLLSLV